MGYVGSRMRRLEDPGLFAGIGHFAGEEERPGQLCRPGCRLTPERVGQLIAASSGVSVARQAVRPG